MHQKISSLDKDIANIRSQLVLFKTTSIAFGGRGLIFKGLANLFLVAMGNSARGSGGANP
jgi:hypothetical protein